MNDLDKHRVLKEFCISLCGAVFVCLWALAILAVLSCLTSCTTTKYIEVPQVHTEYKTRLQVDTLRDSIRVLDSVVVMTKGDTIYNTRWRVVYRDKWHNAIKTDTLLKTDTITKVVVQEVEKKQSRLDKWLDGLKTLFVVIGLLGALIIAIKVALNKFRK